jgi:hypothetical protein
MDDKTKDGVKEGRLSTPDRDIPRAAGDGVDCLHRQEHSVLKVPITGQESLHLSLAFFYFRLLRLSRVRAARLLRNRRSEWPEHHARTTRSCLQEKVYGASRPQNARVHDWIRFVVET